MSSLLVKDSPPELNEWLKSEALLNRRSLSQQILVCLEWCREMYGAPRFRNPFGESLSSRCGVGGGVLVGAELAKSLASKASMDSSTAAQMKQDAASLRKSKARSFTYGCFA